MAVEDKCPCGTGLGYVVCCGPLHEGSVVAASPEALMRSRYSAFARGLVDYVRLTWDPSTCPGDLELDPHQVWTRLRILDAPEAVGSSGVVHFRAHYRYLDERDFLEERSRFERRNGVWLYVDGDIL